jgi:hypothetical protein
LIEPPEPAPGTPDDADATPLGDADRDELADALGRHHAEGRLTLAQLEESLTIVLRADSRQDAVAALSGLPPLGPEPGARRGLSRRRHGESAAPGAAWVPTPERFRDPKSGRIMRVWVDPVTDARHYVADDG